MRAVAADRQLMLDFQPGLAERYPTALDCVRTCVYSHVKPLKSIAADMDMSQSDLSRKLSANPEDPRRFSLTDLETYVAATGDTTPILYLAQKYCIEDEQRQRERVAQTSFLLEAAA